MRRKHQTPEPEKSKPTRMEPMAEGITIRRKPHGFYSKMSDDEFVAYVQGIMAGNGISRRGELQDLDSGLYQAMNMREKARPQIIGKIVFEETHNNWEEMGDDELVLRIQSFMKEKGIKGKKELQKAGKGMHYALFKREKEHPGIVERIGFEEKQKSWMKKSDEEIVAIAKKFMHSKGIRGKTEFEEANEGLFSALLRRERDNPGIMERIGFERMKRDERDWKTMSDDEIVAIAENFIKRERISRRNELGETDQGLYQALRKRGLIDRVFAISERTKHKEAVDGVLDALDSFGDSK